MSLFLLSNHHQGAALSAYTDHVRRREMGRMAVTHNLLILRLIKLFYRPFPSSFPPSKACRTQIRRCDAFSGAATDQASVLDFP